MLAADLWREICLWIKILHLTTSFKAIKNAMWNAALLTAALTSLWENTKARKYICFTLSIMLLQCKCHQAFSYLLWHAIKIVAYWKKRKREGNIRTKLLVSDKSLTIYCEELPIWSCVRKVNNVCFLVTLYLDSQQWNSYPFSHLYLFEAGHCPSFREKKVSSYLL